jgi:predicted hydrocarbon binding protein
MQNTISIVVRKRPGLLAQVVSALVREDCKLLRQAVSPADDPSLQRFTVTIEGPEAAVNDLPRLLRPFGNVEQPAGGAQPAAAPQPAEVEAAAHDIVAAFPDVAERVRALARSLPPAARAATLSALGERLGRREYQRGYALGSPLKLDLALRRMVLPAVRQLAKADLEGSALRLSACPFCTALRSEGRGCDFLVGFARGLLHAAPATADTAVRETRCRAAGDPYCELAFAAP